MILARRTLLLTAPVAALVIRLGHARAAPQPSILANDIWQQPGARAAADQLRAAIAAKLAEHYVGAYRSPMTVKHRLGARYTMELAYDGKVPDEFIDELTTAIACEIAEDVARYRQVFCHGRPIPLVALDGYCAIDVYTFQPVINFYIERN